MIRLGGVALGRSVQCRSRLGTIERLGIGLSRGVIRAQDVSIQEERLS